MLTFFDGRDSSARLLFDRFECGHGQELHKRDAYGFQTPGAG